MTMLRVRLAHLLRRWGHHLGRYARHGVRPAAQQASRWSEGVYEEHRSGTLPTRTTRRRLRYRLYLPRDRAHSGPLPLLVMLHGCQQDTAAFAAGSRMNALADEYGCAVLYPEQDTATNAMRCWNWFDRNVQQGQGAAALIVGLVQELAQREAVDRKRIYVAGVSAGAAMAQILVLRWPALFAACALHSGVMYAGAVSAADALGVMRQGWKSIPVETARHILSEANLKTLHMPAIVVHGSADTAVSPRNSEQIVALHLALAGRWTRDDAPPPPTAENRFEAGGRDVLQRDYAMGATLIVRSLSIAGLAHAWSGGDPQHPFNEAAGPDASRIILEFLLRHIRHHHVEGRQSGRAAAVAFPV